jgi:hypothetical protein
MEKKKDLLPLPGIEPRTLAHPARSLVTNPTALSQNASCSRQWLHNHRPTECNTEQIGTYTTMGRFTLYVTFPFRRGTSPFSKIFSCVIKRICSHWQERLRHVSIPFRRCWERMFDVTARVRTCSIPIMWTVLRLLHYTLSVCLQRVLPAFVFRNGWKINRIGA